MSTARRESPVGVGVLGLGFMGRTHLAAYRAANEAGFPNRVVALCDRNAARFEEPAVTGNLATGAAPTAAFTTTDPAALLAREDLELVSLCTHTDSHVELALRALRAGKHVLVEKPLALAPEPVAELARVARACDRLALPAMCMRFWPGWDALASWVRGDESGAVRRASFQRLSPRPDWSPAFYDDAARSGGPLVDLHVHDADLVLWLFGTPRAVHCTGDESRFETRYDFGPDGPRVSAVGGWDPDPGRAFFMGYELELEGGTLDYALGREPLLTLRRAGREPEALPVAPGTGYDGEVRAALASVARGTSFGPTIEEAIALARLLDAERRSLASGAPVRP